MTEDRLSALPEDLIRHMLSLLPMDSAIRTGTLSKRWLHCWKFIDVIYFQESVVKIEQFSNVPAKVRMYYHSVDDCIGLIKTSKIAKFIVVGCFVPLSKSSIHKWIEFSIAKQVQSMEFYMKVAPKYPFFDYDDDWRRDFFKLPDMFYLRKYTESMENIALTRVDFRPPPPSLCFSGYATLKRLFFFECKLSEEALESVLSTCRVLESLSIIRCTGHADLKISSRSLEEFVYVNPFLFDVETIEIDAPNLVSVKGYDLVRWIRRFDGSSHPSEVRLIECLDPESVYVDLLNNVGNLANLLSNVKVFGTNSSLFLELITKSMFGVNPQTMLKNLVEFHFASILYSKDEIMILFTFLGQCSSLNKIQLEFSDLSWIGYSGHIKIFTSNRNELETTPHLEYESEFVELDDEEENVVQRIGTLQQLKIIELFGYWGLKGNFEVVKRLLLKAPNLKKLILFWDEPEHHVVSDAVYVAPINIQHQLKEELSVLPRASPSAEFIIG